MKILNLKNNDTRFNLAAEEYMFMTCSNEPILVLYINEPSLIVGRYQNVYQEVNLKMIESKKLPVFRRISGGGTVYHDYGNLNYSFIIPKSIKKEISYDSFIYPVVQTLNKIGVKAHKQRNSDIAIDGLKISGSAQKSNKNASMHHGTLLFNSKLDDLVEFLKTTKASIKSTAVLSHSSKVCNIIDKLNEKISIEDFRAKIIENLSHKDSEEIILDKSAHYEIQKLIKEKYDKWEWNYANSPKFEIVEKGEYMLIEKAVIKKIKSNTLGNTANKLLNQKFSYHRIKNILNENLYEEKVKEFLEIIF